MEQQQKLTKLSYEAYVTSMNLKIVKYEIELAQYTKVLGFCSGKEEAFETILNTAEYYVEMIKVCKEDLKEASECQR